MKQFVSEANLCSRWKMCGWWCDEGWEKSSFGYHGDDGNSFCSSGSGQPYGPTFTTGDVTGCCVNLVDMTCFYTKNGVNLGWLFFANSLLSVEVELFMGSLLGLMLSLFDWFFRANAKDWSFFVIIMLYCRFLYCTFSISAYLATWLTN